MKMPMKVSALKEFLAVNSEKPLSFVLPDGDAVPAHYHVTEVGHVTKRFIDCGGTKRNVSSCQLQLWLGQDQQHRLTSGKVASILELAGSVLPPDDLDVEVEYEDCSISQYAVTVARVRDGMAVVELSSKHTDCLAKESCGAASDDEETSCCGSKGCC
jgi:hypothetical protein